MHKILDSAKLIYSDSNISVVSVGQMMGVNDARVIKRVLGVMKCVLDWGGDYTGVHICQNSLQFMLKIDVFLHVNYAFIMLLL